MCLKYTHTRVWCSRHKRRDDSGQTIHAHTSDLSTHIARGHRQTYRRPVDHAGSCWIRVCLPESVMGEQINVADKAQPWVLVRPLLVSRCGRCCCAVTTHIFVYVCQNGRPVLDHTGWLVGCRGEKSYLCMAISGLFENVMLYFNSYPPTSCSCRLLLLAGDAIRN